MFAFIDYNDVVLKEEKPKSVAVVLENRWQYLSMFVHNVSGVINTNTISADGVLSLLYSSPFLLQDTTTFVLQIEKLSVKEASMTCLEQLSESALLPSRKITPFKIPWQDIVYYKTLGLWSILYNMLKCFLWYLFPFPARSTWVTSQISCIFSFSHPTN